MTYCVKDGSIWRSIHLIPHPVPASINPDQEPGHSGTSNTPSAADHSVATIAIESVARSRISTPNKPEMVPVAIYGERQSQSNPGTLLLDAMEDTVPKGFAPTSATTEFASPAHVALVANGPDHIRTRISHSEPSTCLTK